MSTESAISIILLFSMLVVELIKLVIVLVEKMNTKK
ncbi:putative holin-like toxin [Fructobacillus sp. M1-13]|nr:putative holin-like toxin [Fructobacillus papyriferae]